MCHTHEVSVVRTQESYSKVYGPPKRKWCCVPNIVDEVLPSRVSYTKWKRSIRVRNCRFLSYKFTGFGWSSIEVKEVTDIKFLELTHKNILFGQVHVYLVIYWERLNVLNWYCCRLNVLNWYCCKLLLALTLQILIKLREWECKVEILSCISTSQWVAWHVTSLNLTVS